MAWEKFERVHKGHRLSDNVVSIARSKHMVVTSIQEQLGPTVELLYDVDTNRLALRPSDNGKFKVIENKFSHRISLIGFVNHYGLDEAIGKHYHVSREGDLFVIDLNRPIGQTKHRGPTSQGDGA